MFISSTGGHLSELLQLKSLFNEYDYCLVTEKTKSTETLAQKYSGKTHYLVYGTKSHLFSYLFKFAFNIFKSLFLMIKIRPDVVVTTGTHTAVPMCYLAKVFGKKVIFIETFANRKQKPKRAVWSIRLRTFLSFSGNRCWNCILTLFLGVGFIDFSNFRHE